MTASRTRRAWQLDPRRGTTLIELLAVIMIMLMITAATIPAVAPAMAGRRIREGARMLSTFLNAARSRAIETGRPAGVWFERTPGMSDISEVVYMAEIPPMYSGDFLDSTVECSVVDENGRLYRHTDDLTYNMQRYWNIVIPRSRTTFMTDIWANPDPLSQQVVREGDLIQFEGRDKLYPLKVLDQQLPFGGNKWWYILHGRNATTHNGAFNNQRHHNGRFLIRWWERSTQVSFDHNIVRTVTSTPTDLPVTYDRPGIRYKIHRQPVKLNAGSMRLPETVVVDLNFSSLTPGITNQPGIPFHPRADMAQAQTTSALRIPYWGDSVYPNDNTPVVIVFSAGGQVERIYCHQRDNVGNWYWHPTEAFGPIYLLVGDREHMTPDFYKISQSAQENQEIQMKKNWLNLESLWVRISPITGNITVSLVDDPNNTGDYTLASNPANVWTTRLKARTDRLHGGR